MFETFLPYKLKGKILEIKENALKISLPGLKVGDTVVIETSDGKELLGEVVSISKGISYVAPFGEVNGLDGNAKVYPLSSSRTVKVGKGFLGRVVNAFNQPIDDKGAIPFEDTMPLITEPENPLSRKKITEVLDVGVKVVNGLLTIGKGQKIGIFSGAGVGKSTLLGMIARNAKADVNVIALIGERGREVREFIERDLREEGLKKSVVVVATSDEPPSLRIRAAYYATTLAEYFRDKGYKVLLLMDSLTRFCMAGREIGLASGEPPTARGYTPSVFAHLPRLLERAGVKLGAGDITGIYTVLVEGDDFNDPIADAVRSIVDGHIVLSRELAHEAHYPPIDVLASISRVMKDIASEEHLELARETVQILATYKRAEDLINIGGYVKGSNPEIDRAIELIDKLKAFLRQRIEESYTVEESLELLRSILRGS